MKKNIYWVDNALLFFAGVTSLITVGLVSVMFWNWLGMRVLFFPAVLFVSILWGMFGPGKKE